MLEAKGLCSVFYNCVCYIFLFLFSLPKVASRIQAEQNNYDPQLIAQSRAEIETELRDIVLASARAIANNQSPVQHTTPVRVIGNGPHSTQPTQDEKGREREDVKEEKDGRKEESKEEGGREKEGGGMEGTEEAGKRERYPGFRPWPTLQECAAMSLPKTLLFTSTWLSVTAKKIK